MRRAQAGLTLIDVMVAVTLFSIGVLGLVALQANSTQTSFNSESRITSALLADDMVAYFMGNNGSLPSGGSYTDWQTLVSQSLPNGQGTVSGTSGSDMTVTITWLPPSLASAPGSSSGSGGGSSSSSGGASGDTYVTHVYWP